MVNVLIVTILGALSIALLPVWPYSRRWGVYPLGGLVIATLIATVLLAIRQ